MLGFAVLMALSGLGNGIAQRTAEVSNESVPETVEVDSQIQDDKGSTQRQ